VKFSIVAIFALGYFFGLSAFSSPVLSTNELPQYGSHNWQTDEGLPHNTVLTILQTNDRHLWLGTAHGLASFDGIRFTVFNAQNTPQIKGASIRALCESADGTLWFGPDNGGLMSYKDGTFSVLPLSSNAQVKALCETRDGSLWIGTLKGLARYKGGQFTWFTATDGLSDNSILTICEDREGNLWLGTGRGLTLFQDKTGKPVYRYFDLPGDSVRSLFCDRENTLWIGTDGSGAVKMKGIILVISPRQTGCPMTL